MCAYIDLFASLKNYHYLENDFLIITFKTLFVNRVGPHKKFKG